MANIFISYSSADKTIVQRLSKLLESQGWTVWWDRQIPIGQNFDMVIESELDQSDCTLVIWTAKSVASQWVRAEAGEAAKQNKLVPILLEQVEVPLAFRNMEAALLFDWDGEDDHPELELFYKAIKSKINGDGDGKDGDGDGKDGDGKNGGDGDIITKSFFERYKKHIRYAMLSVLGISIITSVIYWTKPKTVHNPHRITIVGRVKTAAELPISQAEINVEGTKHFAVSATDGSYKLTLDEFLPGEEITISTSHPNYEDKFFFFQPNGKEIKDFDIYLNPNNQPTH